MWIYKIINIKTNKVYVGQTIRPVRNRINRHFNDALNGNLDTHLARAIRKYGKDNFVYLIIDEASTQEELNKKERAWIKYYKLSQESYNETDDLIKCGGNTYKNKTNKEMDIIKTKIRNSKLGGKNPNAVKVKVTNTINGEILIFNSQQECSNYFKLSSHMPISRRCRNEIKSLLNDIYKVEYYNK